MKEIQCEPVQVTKFRTEIKQECQTKKDQVRSLNIQFDKIMFQACNVTTKEVPTQECFPSEEQK